MDIHRRRDRNTVRSVEILPPDVQTKVSALSPLDGESQARAVTLMLSHSRTGLLAAIAAQDLPQIVEWKAKGGAIAEIAKQLQLGKSMQQDAAEFLRRAERGLGVAIREGQKRGEVRTKGQSNNFGNAHTTSQPLPTKSRPGPTDFATPSELSGANRSSEGIYAMTDNVPDAVFEEALADARADQNLSRANVARKCKAKARQVIEGAEPADEPEPEPKKRLTKYDSTEILTNISGMLNGVVESLPFIDPSDIGASANKNLIENIRRSIGSIRKLLKEIENG